MVLLLKNITQALGVKNYEVIGLSRKECDFTQEASRAVIAATVKDGDIIVCAAAKAPAKDLDMLIENIAIITNITEGLQGKNLRYVLNISSDAVYGDSDQPMTEDAELVPLSAHGIMHCMREHLLEKRVNAPIRHLRPTLIFGEGDPHNGYGPNAFIRLAQEGKPISLFGEGEERRDHVYVGDVATLAVAMIEQEIAEPVNAVTGEVTSFMDIAKMVKQAAPGTEITPSHAPARCRIMATALLTMRALKPSPRSSILQVFRLISAGGWSRLMLHNLLAQPEKLVRDVSIRLENKEENRAKAMKFDVEYFDGPRTQGYGGYIYDGRWQEVAKRLIKRYQLNAKSKFLDVGCAKGFLMHDLQQACPGIEVAGLDVSAYAKDHAMDSVKEAITLGSCLNLPYADDTFDAAVAINTLHNLPYEQCKQAITELMRVTKHKARLFIQVDAYCNDDEKAMFETWMLTAQTYLQPDEWEALFNELGYQGDYFWTIIGFSDEKAA